MICTLYIQNWGRHLNGHTHSMFCIENSKQVLDQIRLLVCVCARATCLLLLYLSPFLTRTRQLHSSSIHFTVMLLFFQLCTICMILFASILHSCCSLFNIQFKLQYPNCNGNWMKSWPVHRTFFFFTMYFVWTFFSHARNFLITYKYMFLAIISYTLILSRYCFEKLTNSFLGRFE